MAVQYEIDTDKGVVYTTLTGKLSFSESVAHHHLLGADPGFRPEYSELMDGSKLEGVEIAVSGIFSLSISCPFSETAKRAILISNNALHYGIARMWQSVADGKHGEIRVFKERSEAEAWLGIKQADS